jgi:hypothetical protein
VITINLESVVDSLEAQGVPRDVACRKVWEVANRMADRWEAGGMGAPSAVDLIRSAAESDPVRNVREAVSPWLWVLSIIGFGLGLLNTRRIAKMFKDWKRKKGAFA